MEYPLRNGTYHITTPTTNPKERGGHGGCPPETLKQHEGTSSSLINVPLYKAAQHTHFPRDQGSSMSVASGSVHFLKLGNLSLKVL